MCFNSAIRSAANIWGGREAEKARFPYMLSLRDDRGRHFCGGALISSTLGVTAAHCLDKRAWEVHVGRHCTNCEDDFDYDVTTVVTAIPHPRWAQLGQNVSLGGDIALLMLDPPVRGTYLRVFPQEDPSGFLEWQALGFVGYGLTTDRPQVADFLQQADVFFRSLKGCQDNWGPLMQADDVICASGIDAKLCQGDSGGPLILMGDSPEQDFGLGVFSASEVGCSRPNKDAPAVFASFYYYREELRSFLGVEEERSPPAPPALAPVAKCTDDDTGTLVGKAACSMVKRQCSKLSAFQAVDENPSDLCEGFDTGICRQLAQAYLPTDPECSRMVFSGASSSCTPAEALDVFTAAVNFGCEPTILDSVVASPKAAISEPPPGESLLAASLVYSSSTTTTTKSVDHTGDKLDVPCVYLWRLLGILLPPLVVVKF